MMIVLAVVIAYIARRLPFGRHVYAIGDNERAAELSGVKVKQVKCWSIPLRFVRGHCRDCGFGSASGQPPGERYRV
jgi:predicted ABC-type sugar transport system permease subunit